MKANANGDGMDEDGEGPKIKYRKIKYSLPHFCAIVASDSAESSSLSSALAGCHVASCPPPPQLLIMSLPPFRQCLHLSTSHCASASRCVPLLFWCAHLLPPWHDKAMHNDQSSSSSMDTLSGKRSRSRSRTPSCSSSRSCSCSSSSGRSYTNYHLSHDDRKSSGSLKRKYLYSEDDNDRHYHCPDKSDTVFATFAAPTTKKYKHTPK